MISYSLDTNVRVDIKVMTTNDVAPQSNPLFWVVTSKTTGYISVRFAPWVK